MALMASLFSTMIMPAVAVDTTVNVNPSSVTVYRADVFTVNVTVSNASDLCGWEFKLWWNNTLLNCTQVEIRAPSIWINYTFDVGIGLQNAFNSTHGRFWKAQAALLPAPSFNGSMTLVTFTFKALATGTSALDIEDVKLSDSKAAPISHTVTDGTVTVLPPPLYMRPLYMRSDQHTVNNATMYKLVENHTQTARSVNSSVTDPENEAYCYWGVRVWKRSSVGAETELTSGSPVAVVSRTSSGSGLQSATWACPGTSLSVTDCLVVRVYYKFDWTNYTQCSQFITLRLNATSLAASTWTVYYYTQRSYNISMHKTFMYYYWDNNYNSRIENVAHY
jgi:hypothetical protein